PCYIASKRLMAEGGYEVDSSMVYYGRPTRLAPEAEDRIVEAVHDLLPDDFDGQPPQSSQNRQVKPQAKALQGVVVDETGQPLEGADVFFLTFVTGKQVEVATQSDDEGRFGLAAPDEVEGGTEWPAGVLWAIARGRRSTHQRLFWKPAEPHPESLRLVLPPPAETMVKVVGPDDQPLVGAQITVPTVSDPDGSNAPVPKRVAELTTVTTDGAGMAMLTSIGPDEVSAVEVTTPELGVQTQYLQRSAPGTERNVTIKLRRVGRIQGRIEAPDRALVEGVGVYVVSYPFEQPPPADFTLGSASVVSDADGKFEVPALAEGKLMHIFASAPLDQAFLSVPPENVSLVAGKTAELTIPLRPAVRVRGVVREKASGKPLVGVAVGLLDGHGGSAGVPTSVDGRFEFLHLPGQVRMYLFFGKPRELPGWFRQQILTLRVGEKELEFPAIELAVAQGRVVDGAGNAVAGARIAKAVYKHESPDSRTDEVPVMWNSDPRELVTGADGRYRAWVDAGGTYRAEIKLDASVPQWTEWTDFRQVDPPEFPDVVFDSLQSVAGRVLDRQGRPVAGTRVFQSGDGPVRTEIKCDAEGRFVLAGYRAGPGYIFAEMDGYRFHGQPVVAGATEVELVLTKASEPPARRLATLPPLLTADEERALARRVSPSAQMERGNEQEKVRLLQELAKTAPADALDGIEKAGLKGMSANIVRVEVVKRWAVEHPDDALAVIEAIDDPYARAFGYAEAAGLLGAPQRERKLQWLAEAQLQLKSVQDPAMRLALTAHVADLLFESGATDDAVRLAVDCKREAEKLPDNGFAAYTRGTVAEALAHSDLPAALELIKELKDAGEFDRHHGNIARRLAAVNPLESQRVLGMVRDQFQRDQHAVRVAYSMAPAALSRARIVAETINDRDLRAYAYGLMTQALAADGGPVAAKMLDDAFRRLADLAAGDESEHIWGFHVAPVLAAALLPTVESLAPERLDEFFWRSLSLRLPLLKQGPRELTVVMSRAYLAMFLARYDRQTARGLFGDLPDHASRALQGYELDNARRTLYAAAVLVDPQWGIEQLERLPDADRDRARESVVQVLSRQGEAR
ncbi:MAG TPA: hypothetical protein VGX76_17605, partial [Pirellulales bacterium]|nr:hypothetical protein [Pirellulales bacterium]